jgi:hypothetical protein
MSEEFLARQNAYLASMQRNRQRLLSEEQRRVEQELDDCVHQPLITKMAARLQKESVVETSEKFLLRKKEHIDAMRRQMEEKELGLNKPPIISDSSRFLAVKREERLRSQGVVRPSSSPGQRLYALAQHSSQQKKMAIEDQSLKLLESSKVLPESRLIEHSHRLYLDAAARKARLEEMRLSHLNAQENCVKELSWTNPQYSSIRSQVYRDASNFTLVSPFCHDERNQHTVSNERTFMSSKREDASSAFKDQETAENAPLISDMSRLLAENLERRSGISSSERLRMPLEKDREPSHLTPNEKHQGNNHNESAMTSCHLPDPKFEAWREQQLNWHKAKQLKLEEFRRQKDEECAPRRIKTAEVPDDLFFRKQLDKQMRHEQVLESARAAKEKQEAAACLSQKSAACVAASASAHAFNSVLKNTAAHEARIAARFKGDA